METAGKWMTPDPITVERDTTIIETIHLMKEKNIHSLPVTCKGTFCGLITERMINEFSPGKSTSLDTWELHYFLSKATVEDAMNPHPTTIPVDTPLHEAARMVIDNNHSVLCVTGHDGKLAGILTNTNFLEALIDFSLR
jgi:acetoin utilization protein AcuB